MTLQNDDKALSIDTLKPLPIGFQTFRDVINGGFLYVDKTRLIYELVRYPKGVYFLSRPRRFGKSLLISTFLEIFQGNKELFRGLWLYDSPYDWQTYPVIRLDFSSEPVQSATELREAIQRMLARIAKQYGIALDDAPYQAQWQDMILALAQEKRIVILIDEYDKPLVDNLNNIEEAKQIRAVLKGFYGVLKSMDSHLRFVFLTGISKFSKVGVFSDLNNLEDLTMQPKFATITGLTKTELSETLAGYLTLFAQKEHCSVSEMITRIEEWYNGFCFAADSTGLAPTVYSPFSTFLVLKYQRFANHWFESGSPSFLIKLIQDTTYDPQRLQNRKVGELAFSTYELENLDPLALFYQTGYLTIKDYNDEDRLYTLGYPNREVEDSFLTVLLGSFSNVEKGVSQSYLWQLVRALRANRLQEFFDVLKIFFAQIPYTLQIKREKYYQTIFYLLFTLIGLRAQAEVVTNKGRIDAVVEVDEGIYLFEFKLNGDENQALQQIKTTGYYERYQGSSKPLYLVGVNFSTRKREVAKWTTESLIR